MDKGICPITGELITDKNIHPRVGIRYDVTLLGKELRFWFCEDCYEKIPFDKYGYIIKSLILNEKLPYHSEKIHWEGNNNGVGFDLKKVINEITYPNTPSEKLNNLFHHIFRMQDFDGEWIEIDILNKIWHYCYFKNKKEIDLYFETLVAKGFITTSEIDKTFKITYEGLLNYIKLTSEGENSNKCFVAMSFQSETSKYREAIKNALLKTGFEPIIIDEQNIESDKTINDEIIANLRKCKFCIADFSYHKNGVYFESGFALGQGKQVIYTCEEEQFKSAHFDIKPLQHIIYKTSEELESRLISKIEAWIK